MSIISDSCIVAPNSMPKVSDFQSALQMPSSIRKNDRDLDMVTVMEARAKLASMRAAYPSSKAIGFANSMGGKSLWGINQSKDSTVKKEMDENKKRPKSIEEREHEGVTEQQEVREDTEEPKSKRRKKGKKPMDMPRRALSAYNIFFSEQRKLILQEIDNKEQQQGSKDTDSVDSSSSGLNDAKKQEKKAHLDTIPCVLEQDQSAMPRKKRAHRKVHGKISLVVLARKVSQRWKELSTKDREFYQDLAKQDKIRHTEAMKDYKQRKAAEGMLKIKEQEDLNERRQQLQQQNEAICPTNVSSMDENMAMMMMNNNRPQFPSQHIQLQQQQRQQQLRLERIAQNPSSGFFQEALIMEQQRQQENRRRMLSMIGRGGGDYGGTAFVPPAAAFAATPSQPPSGATIHGNQNNMVPLTNLERMMIMKNRAAMAAAAANNNALMQRPPSQENGF